jgi:hypothetical protein
LEVLIKENFDVAVMDFFVVAATGSSDSSGNIIIAATQKLHSMNILVGEPSAALLATQLALSFSIDHFVLEGNALLVILAVNSPELFTLWNFSNLVSDISLSLLSFQRWNTLKVSRYTNYHAHGLVKWVAYHLVFESILIGSSILSSLQIKSEKDPPL